MALGASQMPTALWMWVAAWRLVAATPAAALGGACAEPWRSTRRHAPGGSAGGCRPRAHACPSPSPPPPADPHALLARAGRPIPPAPNGTARAVTWPRRARPTAFFFSVSFSPPPAARPLGLRPRLCAFLSNPSSAPSLRDIQARQSHRRACTVTQCDLCVFESR